MPKPKSRLWWYRRLRKANREDGWKISRFQTWADACFIRGVALGIIELPDDAAEGVELA